MAVDRLAADRPVAAARPDAHLDLVQRLDGQVRERVRREGVDPQREAPSYAASPRTSSPSTTSSA
jgi:pilus assembly protein CpaF